MEAWEALWSTQRAAIVKRIKDNHWGKSADGKTLTGSAGFTIDLAKCPAGWSDTEGLTDNEIKIGMALPQSGVLADSGKVAQAYSAVLNYYAAKGAFTDVTGKTRKKVNVVTRDDAYDPARTIPMVDELIDSEKVFAVSTTGTPPTLKTYDKLNQRCIPQPMPFTGHPAVGDPVNHPWTTSASITYSTEAVIWGNFVEQHLDEFGGKIKVAMLKVNSDLGTAYESAFKAYVDSSPHKSSIDYVSEAIEPSSATVKDQMTTLASQKPNVFIAALVGTQCPQVLTEAAQNGMNDSTKYRFLASTCKASGPVTRDKVGDASANWWSVGGGLKDVQSTSYDNDPWIVAARQILQQAGFDYKSPNFNLGLYQAWAYAQAFQIAGQLDGGLNRSNLILAFRSINMTNPMLLPGIQFNMDGNADAYLLEGSDISQWDVASQSWVQKGLVDISGKTKNCAYNQSTSRCA